MNVLVSGLKRLLVSLSLVRPLRLPTEAVPSTWPAIINSRVSLVALLSPEQRDRLYHIMQLFFREVPIEGCGGLKLSEEIRLTIGAQACLLLLGMPYPRYTRVRRVLVYPSSFVPRRDTLSPSGEIVDPEEPLDGEAWQGGVVVLGWDAVQSANSSEDGENVVFHEFAHMLDAEDGYLDGIPVFDSRDSHRAWASLLSAKFAEHTERAARGEKTVLDPYGSEDRAEFFAVATEAYFTRPVALREEQPELYDLLLEFYKIDPGLLLGKRGADPPR